MQKRSKRRRNILFLSIILIISAGFYLASVGYLNKRVKTRIESEFSKQTNEKYKLIIGSISLSLINRSLVFNKISVIPVKNSSLDATYKVKCSQIKFSGVNLIKYFTAKQLVITKLDLSNPEISITKGRNSQKVESDSISKFSLFNVIKQFANSVNVNRLEVKNFQFQYFDKKSDTIPSLSGNDNNLKIINLYIGPSNNNTPGYFKADTVSFVMNRFSWTTTDSLYSFQIKRMEISYSDSALFLDSIKIEPNYSKHQFADIAGKQTDRFDISLGRLEFIKIDLRRFIEYHDIVSHTLDVVNLSFKAFRDKNDRREFNRPASLQQLIRQIPFYCRVDTIKLVKSIISYEEVAQGKKVPGRITFNKINGNFTGLTNDSLLISTGQVLRFSADCLLMDKGKLNATYIFPLNTNRMVFECKGKMTDLPISALNSMLEPAAGISVSDGFIDTLNFEFKAGENSSKGKMKLIYHDLHLSLPEKDDPGLKDKLGMLIANNFIINKSNPKGKNQPETVDLKYERNKQRFIFHYTWKTLYSGIKSTVGIPDIKNK